MPCVAAGGVDVVEGCSGCSIVVFWAMLVVGLGWVLVVGCVLVVGLGWVLVTGCVLVVGLGWVLVVGLGWVLVVGLGWVLVVAFDWIEVVSLTVAVAGEVVVVGARCVVVLVVISSVVRIISGGVGCLISSEQLPPTHAWATWDPFFISSPVSFFRLEAMTPKLTVEDSFFTFTVNFKFNCADESDIQHNPNAMMYCAASRMVFISSLQMWP